MRITIESDAGSWTEIEIVNHLGQKVFDGTLKRDQDGWHLAPRVKGIDGNRIGHWRSSGSHVAVLSKALAVIAKLEGCGQ